VVCARSEVGGMPAALRRTLIFLLAAAAALLVSSQPATAQVRSDEADFVGRINAARQAAGLPAYATSDELTAVARRHAQRMADRGEHHHNANLANEIIGWMMLGENVGRGSTVDGLHRAFMASPSHRANVLRREFTQVGVGVVRNATGRIFVVEVFRQPGQVTAAPAPPPRPAPAPAPRPAPAPSPVPPTTVAPAPTAPPTAPTTTRTVPPESVETVGAASAPGALPVVATVASPASEASLAGPASVAAGLIAGLFAGHAAVRRQLEGA
jgi:uncharacterized protein YkwD